MNKPILVTNEFSDFLINRDRNQGDGTFTGIEFRGKFLSVADSKDWWTKSDDKIVLDFKGVDTIGPSWANEVFAYFTKYDVNQDQILSRFILLNISQVKLALIKREITSGYKV